MKKLFYNGKVYVNRDEFQEAIYLEGEFIKEVGKTEDLVKKYDQEDVEKVDLEGRTVIPGLNDSHLHFMQFGESMNQVDIEGVESIQEMIDRCKIFMEKNPKRCEKGIHAIGWNQDFFKGDKRIPNRFDLDKISTEIPIVLERVCGHIVSSNTKVIEILGLTKDSPQYPDGEFLIGDDGYPSGVYTANACNFAKDVIPDFTLEERREMLIETMDYAVSCGLTSVQSNDVGTTFMNGPVAFDLLKDIYKENKKIRYRHQVCFNDFGEFENYLTDGEYSKKDKEYDTNYLKLGPLKLFKDGSLGARTALMRDGYNDDRDNHGLPWIKDEEMRKYVNLASENNLQVITHVIGDKAIEDTIKCYEDSFVNGENKLRHTLVHCQITDRELVERIARDDICVMAQPIFLDYDMQVVEDRCGKELASTSYAFKSLKDLGAHVAYGTDAPVENLNPFPNIYMAVTRKDKKGNPEGGFYPKECVDIYEAIDAYTVESAYVEFQEEIKGRIKKDFLADFVVLDEDIFTIDPMEIKDIKPRMTIVGGNVVYKRWGNMTLEIKGIENLNNRERLDYMVDFGKATIKTEGDIIAMMANISSIIFNVVEDLNWAGFYLVKEDELVLGPFQGLPACTRLAGEGVCVAAWKDKKIMRIENVHDFPGHVACDSASNSELVLPILVKDEVIGVLDLDSPSLGRFTSLEEEKFRELVKAMEEELSK